MKTEFKFTKRAMLVIKFSLASQTSFGDVEGFRLPERELIKAEVSIPLKDSQKQEIETSYEHYDVNAEIPDSGFRGGGDVTDKQSE